MTLQPSPVAWVMPINELLRHCLYAIEAGASAPVVMNVEGLKENLRAALASQAQPEQPKQDSFHLTSDAVVCAATVQPTGEPLSDARQEQARQQCLAVVHMAKALQEVHESRALILAHTNLDLVEEIGESTAYIMESLGDMLSNMDAVDSAEDEWLDPVFEAAHTMWPQSPAPGPADTDRARSDEKEESVAALPEPFWHAVISEECPVIDKAIRRADVAEEHAQKCRDLGYAGVEVVPLYRVAALPVQQWQPISTRPIDGTRYLAVCATGLVRLVHQDDPYDRLPTGDDGDHTVWPNLPTHWMPLPPPPADQGEQQ